MTLAGDRVVGRVTPPEVAGVEPGALASIPRTRGDEPAPATDMAWQPRIPGPIPISCQPAPASRQFPLRQDTQKRVRPEPEVKSGQMLPPLPAEPTAIVLSARQTVEAQGRNRSLPGPERTARCDCQPFKTLNAGVKEKAPACSGGLATRSGSSCRGAGKEGRIRVGTPFPASIGARRRDGDPQAFRMRFAETLADDLPRPFHPAATGARLVVTPMSQASRSAWSVSTLS